MGRRPPRRRALLAAGALAVLLYADVAWAQTATVSMTADRTELGVGETFNLQVRVDADGASVDHMVEPDLSAFRVMSRRMTQPVQFRFGFGGQQQVLQVTTIHSYTLMALSPGTYPIDPVRVTVGGRSFQGNGLTITVRNAGQAPPQNGMPDPPDPLGAKPPDTPPNMADSAPVDGAQFDPEAFVRTVVDKEQPYVGEQVTVTVYLYVRSRVRSSPAITREPTADGFWVVDLLPPQRTLQSTLQQVNGVPFNVYVLRRWAMFPLREGDLTVGAMELTVETGSLFDMFRGPRALQRTGVPVTLHARPLPSGPAGAVVGDFSVESRLDRTQVGTGDAVTLTATVHATRGNVRDARLSLPPTDGLRVLAPQTRDTVEHPRDMVGGTRVFEWLIVPEREGTYRLGPLGLDVFDPRAGTYRRVEAPALTLTAAGAAIAPSPSVDTPADTTGADDSAPPEESFGPLRTHSELRRYSPPTSSSVWYPWILALGPMAWLGVLLVQTVRRRVARARESGSPRRALRSARRRLAGARDRAEHGDATGFYGEVAGVLLEVLQVRLGEPVAGMTHRELREHLEGRGMETELSGMIIEELEGCDFARFSAAGGGREEMDRCATRIETIVERLDHFAPVSLEDQA